jgi:hypothetical protein
MADAWTLFGSVELDISEADHKLDTLDKGVVGVGDSFGKTEKVASGFLGKLKQGGGLVGSFAGSLGKAALSGGSLNDILGAGLNSFKAMPGPIGLVATGLGLVTDSMGGFVDAAREERDEVNRFNQSLKNSIPNWDGNTKAVDNLIGKMEKLGYTDTETRDAVDKLAFRTHDLKLSQEGATVAADLAARKHISLADASELVGKALDGNVGPLRKMGIELEKGADAHTVLAQLQKQTAGAAEAYANTQEGAAKRQAIAWDNLQEKIGGAVLPVFDALTQAGYAVSGMLMGGIGAAVDFIGPVIGGVTTLIGDGIGTIVGWAQSIGSTIGEALVPLQGPLKLVQDAFGEIGKAWEKFTGLIGEGDFFGALGGLFSDLGTTIGNFASNIGPAIAEAVPKVLDNLGTLASNFWNWLTEDVIPGVGAKIGEFAGAIIDWFKTPGNVSGVVTTVGKWGENLLSFVGGAILGIGGALLGFAGGVIDWFKTPGNVEGVVNTVWEWGKNLLSFVGGAILGIGGALLDFAGGIVEWFSTPGNAESLLTTVSEWGMGLLNFVGGAIVGLGGALLEFVGGIVGWFLEPGNAQSVLDTVGKWGENLLSFVGGAVAGLPKALGDFVGEIGSNFTDETKRGKLVGGLMEVGGHIIGAIFDGIKAGAGKIWTWLSGIATQVWDTISNAFGGANLDGLSNPNSYGTQNSGGKIGVPDGPADYRGLGGSTPPILPPIPRDNRPLGGGRAAGGPVTGGIPYLVGENGPEIFMPSQSGTIIPNHKLGGQGPNTGFSGVGGIFDAYNSALSFMEKLRAFDGNYPDLTQGNQFLAVQVSDWVVAAGEFLEAFEGHLDIGALANAFESVSSIFGTYNEALGFMSNLRFLNGNYPDLTQGNQFLAVQVSDWVVAAGEFLEAFESGFDLKGVSESFGWVQSIFATYDDALSFMSKLKLSGDNYPSLTQANRFIAVELWDWVQGAGEFIDATKGYIDLPGLNAAFGWVKSIFGGYDSALSLMERVRGYKSASGGINAFVADLRALGGIDPSGGVRIGGGGQGERLTGADAGGSPINITVNVRIRDIDVTDAEVEIIEEKLSARLNGRRSSAYAY